jgi:hypothetical protein
VYYVISCVIERILPAFNTFGRERARQGRAGSNMYA